MGTVQPQHLGINQLVDFKCLPHRPVVHRTGSCRRINTPAITEHTGSKITAAYGVSYNCIRTDHSRFTFNTTISRNFPTISPFNTGQKVR